MNDKIVKPFSLFLFILLFLTLNCSDNQNGEVDVENIPTISEADSIHNSPTDTIRVNKSKEFEIFFDDFMWSEELQRERVIYPFITTFDTIKSSDGWEYWPFYSVADYIPQISMDTVFGDLSEASNKNVVSILRLEDSLSYNYNFIKNESKWFLSTLEKTLVSEMNDSEFLSFLIKFSKDSIYQMKHVKFPLRQLYAGGEDYETIESYSAKKDWKCLDFINGKISYRLFNGRKEFKYRNVSFFGIDNGIFVNYRFENINGEWVLILDEDYST